MAEICAQHLPKTAKLFFFGSRTKGTDRPLSDIDLLVDAGTPLTLAKRDALYAFDESLLPFKVDMADARAISSTFRQAVQAQLIPFEYHRLLARDA